MLHHIKIDIVKATIEAIFNKASNRLKLEDFKEWWQCICTENRFTVIPIYYMSDGLQNWDVYYLKTYPSVSIFH